MAGTSKKMDMGGITLTLNDLELGVTAPGKVGTGTALSSAELGLLDTASAGAIVASKVAVANSSGQLPTKRVVYNHTTGATRTLTSADSGGLVYLNKADGVVVTLPAAAAGLWFDFAVGTSVTSNAYKVITSAGTEFIKGQLVSVDTDSTNALAYDQVGNGTTHVAVNMNGTTTGGLIYTRFKLVCISTTLWHIEGMNFGSGTVATPFATS